MTESSVRSRTAHRFHERRRREAVVRRTADHERSWRHGGGSPDGDDPGVRGADVRHCGRTDPVRRDQGAVDCDGNRGVELEPLVDVRTLRTVVIAAVLPESATKSPAANEATLLTSTRMPGLFGVTSLMVMSEVNTATFSTAAISAAVIGGVISMVCPLWWATVRAPPTGSPLPSTNTTTKFLLMPWLTGFSSTLVVGPFAAAESTFTAFDSRATR